MHQGAGEPLLCSLESCNSCPALLPGGSLSQSNRPGSSFQEEFTCTVGERKGRPSGLLTSRSPGSQAAAKEADRPAGGTPVQSSPGPAPACAAQQEAPPGPRGCVQGLRKALGGAGTPGHPPPHLWDLGVKLSSCWDSRLEGDLPGGNVRSRH